jgi:N-acetylmuramoyl-L-alanine amidase
MEVTIVITISIKQFLAVLVVFVLAAIFFIPSHGDQTAYADTSSLQLNASNQNIGATVKANLLNVRENPSVNGKIVGYLKMGTKITIQEEQSGWAKLSGIQGWVSERYIAKDASASISPPQEEKIDSFNEKGQTESTQSSSQEPLRGKTIVLDPGHGGKDCGATSIDGTHEKALTLETAKVVKKKLEDAGANVIMTRTTDTFIPLEKRAAISNQNQADAFISFHYNWSNDLSVNGITNFYYQKSKDRSLASDLLNEIVKATKISNIGTRFDDLSVLRNNLQPSTLIELGFLSSKQDNPIIESSTYRKEVAQGVYLGLLDYFQLNN